MAIFSYRRRRLYRKHTVIELQSAGYDVVVLDNLSNSSEKMSGKSRKDHRQTSKILQGRYS